MVFAVKGRENLIDKVWKDDLYKYIAGIIKGKEQKSIIVNGMPDHIPHFCGSQAFYVCFRFGYRYKK